MPENKQKTPAGPPPDRAQPTEPADPKWIEIAKVGRPHGLRGEVNLQVHNADSAVWERGLLLRAWLPGKPAFTLKLLEMRPARDVFVARFDGVDDRTAAEALTHAILQVGPDVLPPVEDDEVYLHELLGATVLEAETGLAQGKIVGFIEGAQLVLEIALDAGGSALIPADAEAIESLGREKGKVVVRHLEDWRST